MSLTTLDQRLVSSTCILVSSFTLLVSEVRAHADTHTTTDGVVTLDILIVISAVVGLASGLAAIHLKHESITSVVNSVQSKDIAGVGLLLAGVVLVGTNLPKAPILSISGAGIGSLMAFTLSRYHYCASDTHSQRGVAPVVVLTIGVHRAVEGFIFSMGNISTETVGLVTALLITSHAALETAVVGGVYSTIGHRRRGLVAVFFVQCCFLFTAFATVSIVLSVPPLTQQVVTAAAGGILLNLGANEYRSSNSTSI